MQKIQFDILTIFPNIFDSYFGASILKRAQEKKLIKIAAHDIRTFTKDKHHKVDDPPYGGGAGMVLKAEPVLKAFEKIKGKRSVKAVILSAKGKPFDQKMAYAWAKARKDIIFITGRYEGIDERVKTILSAEEVSIGPYVLTDGDIATMVIISAVARLIPGVIKLDSLKEESHWNLLLKKESKTKGSGLEYAHYTKPEIVTWKGKKYRVPKVLLSGNHKKIEEWRSGLSTDEQ